ncbi:recombinase family protein [Sphingomonas sp. PP-F2F-G114-C0414]|uniref:recombinase family protein n=1 Tax=Sphingomonas sp. PP-F2F-G114-C0414 TaxID=2135662 RepID=UPI000EF91B1B
MKGGGHVSCREAATAGARKRHTKRLALARTLHATIASFDSDEGQTAASIARALNARQIPSPTGKVWYRQQVTRLGLTSSVQMST